MRDRAPAPPAGGARINTSTSYTAVGRRKTSVARVLLQPGSDKPHPGKTSEEIASLAPNIEIQKDWRGPEFLDESIKRVRAFLEKHTPR